MYISGSIIRNECPGKQFLNIISQNGCVSIHLYHQCKWKLVCMCVNVVGQIITRVLEEDLNDKYSPDEVQQIMAHLPLRIDNTLHKVKAKIMGG